jgi:hypothetical protein
MAQALKTASDRIMAAVCDCCGAHAHEYPFEVFQVCAACGRGTYIARAVTVADHVANLPKKADPFQPKGDRHAA